MAKKKTVTQRARSSPLRGICFTGRGTRTPRWRRSSRNPAPPGALFITTLTAKDALLSSLSYLFDDKYVELLETLDTDQNAFDILMYLNRELFGMIERTVSVELLAQMYAAQLTTKGEKAPAGPGSALLPPAAPDRPAGAGPERTAAGHPHRRDRQDLCPV